MEPTLKAVVVPVTPFQQNATILVCTRTGEAAVVDPGGEVDRLLAAAHGAAARIAKVLLTHGHVDHAGGAAELAGRLGVPIEGPHPDDAFWIEGIAEQGVRFGMPEARSFVPDRWLADGDEVTIGEARLAVLHCPGHTPGHVAYFHGPSRLALVGDVLFRGSIGRTDLARGDHARLIASIRDKLWPLGSDVTFIPGHGPASTFDAERRGNPFVADRVLGQA